MARFSALTKWTRFLARCVVGLLWFILGGETLLLFTSTREVIPEEFTSWDALGCSPLITAAPGARFSGLTECGRAFMIGGGPPDQNHNYHLSFHDVWTGELLGRIESPSPDYILSSTKTIVLTRDFGGAELAQLASGKQLASLQSDGPVQTCICAGSDLALVRSDNGGEVWNMETGARVRAFLRKRKTLSFGFCTADGEPKCIEVMQPSGQLELWDEIADMRKQVLLEGVHITNAPPGYTTSRSFRLSPDCRLIAIPDGISIRIVSLEDGGLLWTVPTPPSLCLQITYSGSALQVPGYGISFSPDNHWLTYEYQKPNVLVAKVQGWNFNLGQRLATWLPPEYYVELFDLKTGFSWLRIPAGHRTAFSDDSSRLVTFGKKGRYIWTVPPRTRPFTPWAWAALAGSVAVAGVWRALRGVQKNDFTKKSFESVATPAVSLGACDNGSPGQTPVQSP
jgi:hypothetical protein